MNTKTLSLFAGIVALSMTTGCVLEELEDTSGADDTSAVDDTGDTEDTGETKTECDTFTEEGCYWMENTDGLNCWVPMGDTYDYDTCRSEDSCTEGGGGASGGGCYKWSTGSEGTAANWACDYFAGEACYWMENTDGNYCWVPAPEGDVDQETCQVLDSCSEGGGGESGGGCYKWSENSTGEGAAWE